MTARHGGAGREYTAINTPRTALRCRGVAARCRSWWVTSTASRQFSRNANAYFPKICCWALVSILLSLATLTRPKPNGRAAEWSTLRHRHV